MTGEVKFIQWDKTSEDMILFIGGYYLTDPDDSNSLRIAVIDEFKFNSDYFSDGQSQSEHRKRLIDSSG